jgi:hypothetical protein
LYNPYQPLRINRIDCDTVVHSGRRTADIEAIELDSDTYRPGDTVRATVFVKPYKESRQRQTIALKLPADLPEGSYTATVCDDLLNARLTTRDNPTLNNPTTLAQVLDALQVQIGAKRTNLVLRLPTGDSGVALEGRALPNLPPSMVHILANGRRTGAQPLRQTLVARKATDWVIQGSETVRFTVSKLPRYEGRDGPAEQR